MGLACASQDIPIPTLMTFAVRFIFDTDYDEKCNPPIFINEIINSRFADFRKLHIKRDCLTRKYSGSNRKVFNFPANAKILILILTTNFRISGNSINSGLSSCHQRRSIAVISYNDIETNDGSMFMDQQTIVKRCINREPRALLTTHFFKLAANDIPLQDTNCGNYKSEEGHNPRGSGRSPSSAIGGAFLFLFAKALFKGFFYLIDEQCFPCGVCANTPD